MSAEWRIIDSGPSGAARNMALDEALARRVTEGGGAPVLRVYCWDRPSVSIGRFQKLSGINTSYCSDSDIPIVRRPTGGRAILHGQELTYSFSAQTRTGAFAGNLFDAYSALGRVFLCAFESLGLKAHAVSGRKSAPRSSNPLCFSAASYAEITSGGRKIIGSAQRRWRGGMLQQGSIPFRVSAAESQAVFGTDTGADIAGLREFVETIDYLALKRAIVRCMELSFEIRLVEGCPTHEDEALAAELEAQKYQAHEWNHLR